jgi:hypothetical protein
MSTQVFDTLEQGSDEWLAARCGILTASVIGQLITPKTIKPAANDYSRALTAHLVAERITGYVEPIHTSYDMERGTMDEPYARDIYSERYAPVTECGFIIHEGNGIRLGYSPDGLVGTDGLIEIKSRRQKKHLATILDGAVPLENMAQIQCGLLVSGRSWCDYVSYCGGMPLWTCRVTPDPRWHETIITAAETFEDTAAEMINRYHAATKGQPNTKRIDHYQEMSF